jgi:soluble lytic murein transglycosylase-like protein
MLCFETHLTFATAWRHAAAASALGCALLGSAHAQVYMGVSETGTLLLSNHASAEAPITFVAAEPAPQPVAPPQTPARNEGATSGGTRQRPGPAPPPKHGSLIQAAAQRQALPEALLTAIIAVESGFNDRAVSRKGALGLMQLMPATARKLGVRNAFVPEDNIQAGAAYLRELLEEFQQDLRLALAAYNAGPVAVRRAGGRVPAIAETQDYVSRVLALAGMPPR